MIGLPCLLVAADTPSPVASLEPLSRFWNVRIGDIIMIFAVFFAPLFALWAQWRLQLRRESRDQRIRIFKTLMATRATALDINHVQSLNMIDVEFSKNNEPNTAIREAWRTYHEHLNVPRPMQDEMQGRRWDDNQRDFLAQMLSKIGKSLGYSFDFTYYKRGAYHPSGLGDNWNEMEQIRKRWLAVLNGEPLKMAITSFPAQPAPPADPPQVQQPRR
jgi:hypothetical protein